MSRFMAPLPNFSEDEGKCKDWCGKDTSPKLMIILQCFIWYLENLTGKKVRCLITGPARCTNKQTQVYGGKCPPSYHMGQDKVDKGTIDPGVAADCVFQTREKDGWLTIPKAEAAAAAQNFGLFGGIGWKKYGPSLKFVHLDLGPKRTF